MDTLAIETCSDLEKFGRISREMLFQIAEDRKYLRKLVLGVAKNEKLLASCAHYEAVDKLVLWNSEDQKMQLRLHIYSDRGGMSTATSQIDIAEVHNHRWNFSSLILSGGYRHTIYKIDKEGYVPMMVRYEGVDDCYTLHHSQYHAIIEEPDTVSLILRGPPEKERFQVIKEEGGELKWQEGSLLESIEEKSQKRMSADRYQGLVNKLTQLAIL